MANSRNITDFFKAYAAPKAKEQNLGFSSSPADSRVPSFPSPHGPPPLSQPGSLDIQKGNSTPDGTDKGRPDSMPASQGGGSFNSSQRVIKNGKIVVTSSDGDDTDSISSIEDPDALLRMFTAPSAPTVKERSVSPTRPLRSRLKAKTGGGGGSKKPSAAPKYKFSLESLVSDAVDDNEVEAGVAKLRKTFEASQDGGRGAEDKRQKTGIDERLLASTMDDDEDGSSFQRLLDAVNRTDTFNRDRSWSFFEHRSHHKASPEPFPGHTGSDNVALAALKDPASRERIIYSAFLNNSFSSKALPDEVILWILNAIPSEPRDNVRYAYCRAFDFSPGEWISSNLRPAHIDSLFRKLGARPAALDLSASLETTDGSSADEYQHQDWRYLISILSLLTRLAEKFSQETREHTLNILLRLTLDAILMTDCSVCLGVENAISALFRTTNQSTDTSVTPHIAKNLFKTIQEQPLRARLLKHVNAITPSVSFFRCRLALSFFFQDAAPLDEPIEKLFDLKRIATHLDDEKFNFNRLRAQRGLQFDFGELAALTTFLDIGVCTGTASLTLSSSSSTPLSPTSNKKTKQAEESQFNADVDSLANRIKSVFNSIEDSGASHLKRTETKESLEALYYRILYSVRTKQRPKKMFFDSGKQEDWSGMGQSGTLMEKFLKSANDNSTNNNLKGENDKENGREKVEVDEEKEMPIRKHDTEQ